MNNIQIFSHKRFGKIRTMTMPDGQVWFVGKDVAERLGYSNTKQALLTHVDDEDKLRSQIATSGQNRMMVLINESGLYSLVLQSKLPQAKEFKHWVTSEVLPQIRKTGGYVPVAAGDDENAILSKALLIAQRTLSLQRQQLLDQEPKVAFAEALTASDGTILIRDLAKLLTQNGYPIGQNRLFKELRQRGYLFQQSTRPIQRYVEQGIFVTHVVLVETHHGTKELLTTRVTAKGQQYFLNVFLNEIN
ncbi:MAG: phage antirepressor KilAC domain-containing protein [Bacteroidales bacterium]|nr:phage antirepressor KilAC domain-containing protein [Bacteroidales bacterium]